MKKTKKSRWKFWAYGTGEMIVIGFFILLISIATAEIGAYITSQKMKEQADREFYHHADAVRMVVREMITSTEWIVNSFLSGFTKSDLESENTSGTKFTNVHSMYDGPIKFYTEEDIFRKIESFITYNNDLYSATLIFEPGVMERVPKGIAAMVFSADTQRYNLLDMYDVFNFDFYKSVARKNSTYIAADWTQSSDQFVLTFAIPIFDKHKKLMGEFWVDALPNSVITNNCYDIKNSDDYTFIIDTSNIIISSPDSTIVGIDADSVMKLWNLPFTKEAFFFSSDSILANRIQIDKHPYCIYHIPLSPYPFEFVIIKSEQQIYQAVSKVKYTLLFVSLSSIILIFLCLFYAYRFYKKKNDENMALENELDIAAQIQQQILPPNEIHQTQNNDSAFDIYGILRPARAVGGDLFDYIQKEHQLYFCIGDVSGKGMPAALMMTQICSLFRYICRNEDRPEIIASNLNNVISERVKDCTFCTMFIGILDLETGQIKFCDAGHNPPILINKASRECNYLSLKPNLPIGVFEDAKYEMGSLTLKPGDKLFLYTDGVTEAKNAQEEFYGEEKTIDTVQHIFLLPIDQLIDNMLYKLEKFSFGAEQHDDITMLCIEYKKQIQNI